MKERFKEVYTNDEGYTFYIDKELTEWANHLENNDPYLVYLVKSGDTSVSRLLLNNKKQKVIGEIPLYENDHQACTRIDVFKIWSKEE
jgi:fermentation-respiration switch protein FrsA (DUF1100 family)